MVRLNANALLVLVALSVLTATAGCAVTSPDDGSTGRTAQAIAPCLPPPPPGPVANLLIFQGPAGPAGVFVNAAGMPGPGAAPPGNVVPPGGLAGVAPQLGVQPGAIQAQVAWVNAGGPAGANNRQVFIQNGVIIQIQGNAPGGGGAGGAAPPPPAGGGPIAGGGGGAALGGGGAVAAGVVEVAWPLLVAALVAGTVVYVLDCSTHEQCLFETVEQAGGWDRVFGTVPDPNARGNPSYVSASCTEAREVGLTTACWNAIGYTQTGYGNALSGFYTCRDVFNAGVSSGSIWGSWTDAVNLCTGLVAACEENTSRACGVPRLPVCAVADVPAP